MAESIESLKRKAKERKRAQCCSHAEALDMIAREHGSQNWSLLMKHRDSIERPRLEDPLAEARLAIKAVMEQMPLLTAFGIGVYRERRLSPEEWKRQHEIGRGEMLQDRYVEQFRRACAYLTLVGRRKTINPRYGSYGFKHRVERYWKKHHAGEDYYVANGMFIAAALHLGFKARRIEDSPNASFNISSKALPG